MYNMLLKQINAILIIAAHHESGHTEGEVHLDVEHEHVELDHGHHHEGGAELHNLIGVSLVLGFIFMLLVDQLSGGGHSHGG